MSEPGWVGALCIGEGHNAGLNNPISLLSSLLYTCLNILKILMTVENVKNKKRHNYELFPRDRQPFPLD